MANSVITLFATHESVAVGLHREVVQALTDLVPSPSFTHAAPALHELRWWTEALEDRVAGLPTREPDEDRPPRNLTVTYQLRDMLEAVTTACLQIEPTARREYGRNVDRNVQELLEADEFELRASNGEVFK